VLLIRVRLADGDVAVSVDLVADETQGCFEIAGGGAEGVGVDGKRGADDDKRRAVAGRIDGLFDGQAADGLDRNGDGLDDFAEAIERAGDRLTALAAESADIVADVVDDEIAAEIFEAARCFEGIGHGHDVAHDFDAKVAAGFHDELHCFRVGLTHYDHHASAGFGHQLGFEAAAVHDFKVGNDGDQGVTGAKFADAARAFGEDERRSGFDPIDAGAESQIGR